MARRPPSYRNQSGSARRATTTVRTAAGRSVSSSRWLHRQLNDPYVAEAARLGYRARSAFKLIQLDDKLRLLRPGQRIVDLGAAPGGWTQVAVERTDPDRAGGRVVALDLLAMEAVPGATVLHLDFLGDGAPDALKAALAGPADLVLSDMAAPTTGHARTDHLRIMALAEAAFAFTRTVLAPGGAFVCKLFQGGAERQLLEDMKQNFEKVRHVKPPASRSESSETYLVATGYRGVDDSAPAVPEAADP